MMKVAYLCSWRSWSEKELNCLVEQYDLILVAFAGISEDGTVLLPAEVAELTARLPKGKVGISVGGWTYRHQFKPALFSRLIQSLTELQFDLIDIDWEFDSLEEAARMKADYAYLVTELSRRKRVSCAITPAQRFLVEDLKLEFVTLMAYDQSGPWSKTADHYAPYNVIRDLLPLGKQYLLGISMATVTFYRCKQPGDSFSKCEIVPWNEYQPLVHWDPVFGSAYACHEGNLVYGEDAVSIAEKYQLAIADGLGGITIWDAKAC